MVTIPSSSLTGDASYTPRTNPLGLYPQIPYADPQTSYAKSGDRRILWLQGEHPQPKQPQKAEYAKRSPAPRTDVRGAGDLNSFLQEALAEHLTIVLVDVLTSLLCRLEGIPLHSLQTTVVLVELGDVDIDVHQ